MTATEILDIYTDFVRQLDTIEGNPPRWLRNPAYRGLVAAILTLAFATSQQS